MTMTISNGPTGTYQVVFVDRVGTIYLINDAASDLFRDSAAGAVDGDVLAATWLRARCGNVAFDFGGGQFFMESLLNSDQLFGMDVYWDRTGWRPPVGRPRSSSDRRSPPTTRPSPSS